MAVENLSPAYRIHTQRLVVRCWNPGDAPLLSAAIAQSLEHLKAWMPWAHGESKDLQQRMNWLRQSRGKFDYPIMFAQRLQRRLAHFLDPDSVTFDDCQVGLQRDRVELLRHQKQVQQQAAA